MSAVLLAAFSVLNAQKKTVKPAAIKPALPALKTLNDSASYAIGISVANFYKQQGVTRLNITLVSKAMNDIQGGKKTLFDDATANAVMNRCMSMIQEEKSKPRLDSGIHFLAENKRRPGVKTTAS